LGLAIAAVRRRKPGALFKCVVDACSLINIERARRMAVLRQRSEELVIPNKVAKQVSQPGTPLKTFIDGHEHLVSRPRNSEGEEYLRILQHHLSLEEPDALAIAMAHGRRLPLITDDGPACDVARGLGIETHSWREFLNGRHTPRGE